MAASKTAAVQFQAKPTSTQDLESGTASTFYQTALVFAKPHTELVVKVVLDPPLFTTRVRVSFDPP